MQLLNWNGSFMGGYYNASLWQCPKKYINHETWLMYILGCWYVSVRLVRSDHDIWAQQSIVSEYVRPNQCSTSLKVNIIHKSNNIFILNDFLQDTVWKLYIRSMWKGAQFQRSQNLVFLDLTLICSLLNDNRSHVSKKRQSNMKGYPDCIWHCGFHDIVFRKPWHCNLFWLYTRNWTLFIYYQGSAHLLFSSHLELGKVGP